MLKKFKFSRFIYDFCLSRNVPEKIEILLKSQGIIGKQSGNAKNKTLLFTFDQKSWQKAKEKTVVLPYFKGVSEQIHRVLRKYDYRIVYKGCKS